MDNIQGILIAVGVLGALGMVFAALLSYASEVFHVKVDRKVEEVRAVLPGANCGACGFPGCDGLAKAIAQDGAPINSCPIGGAPLTEKLAAIMGLDAVASTKEVACVMCQGDKTRAKEKYNYVGRVDCRSMALEQGGNKSCSYGCLGGGTCQTVCDFGAIEMVNGLAVIDRDKCTSCKKCIDVCPKQLIELIPYDAKTQVKCKSRDNGKVVRANCSVGCIGCKICEKQYPEGFKVENLLAKAVYDPNNIDQEKLDAAIAKCPMKTIYPGLEVREEVKKEEKTA